MVVEYLLLLLVSGAIIATAFTPGNGPIKMFQVDAPRLASRIQTNLISGEGFVKIAEPGGIDAWQ